MTETVHFPQLAIGGVVFHQQQILLVKRGRPPAENEWAIPGGKVHAGETLQQATERELLEETGISIRAGEIVHSFELIQHDEQGNLQFHYVVIDLQGEYLSGIPRASDDALDARWWHADELHAIKLNSSTEKLLREKYHFITRSETESGHGP